MAVRADPVVGVVVMERITKALSTKLDKAIEIIAYERTS